MRWVYAVLGEYAFRAVRVVGELLQHGAHLLFVARRSRSASQTDLGASSSRSPASPAPSMPFHSTFDHHALAKCGSMPDEQSESRAIVPVARL